MNSAVLTKEQIEELISTIGRIYLEDEIPWVVGYSGGKDSTATLQLVWYAIMALPSEKRKHKTVHVISTDTLVESPVVAAWVNHSLDRMKAAKKEHDLPFEVHRLTPKINNTFWVNLIGKGYPAPRATFRWCTNRLKIEPSNDFIRKVIDSHGEAILVLGTRKAESANRARSMNYYEQFRTRDYLSPNASMPNSLVFSPIEHWSNDNVWQYLLQYKNPWGHSNRDLLTMYRGASADGECPLVLNTDTPSCGKSRFGCWICTLVEQDKSMAAMIQNDEEKVWMAPLLDLRNDIGNWDKDRERRDFRRMDGKLLIHNGRLVHGPYPKEVREYWLKRLLEVENRIQNEGPEGFQNFVLVSMDELREIRRIWLQEKHEFDDSLPVIYNEVKGLEYPYKDDFASTPFGHSEWQILKQICTSIYPDEELLMNLQSALLDIERRASILNLRKGILESLEDQIRKCFYKNEDDAFKIAEIRAQRASTSADEFSDIV